MVNCPNCRGAMEALPMTSRVGATFDIDACWTCHLVWFDQHESAALAPQSVVELFKRIHDHQKKPDQVRQVVNPHLNCPRCSSGLKVTHDLHKGGRFSYHRCGHGHGRVSSFTQFLREKNFIRTLSATEISTLSVKVKQIRCSSCGASINLEKDTACTHCGSAISVLDHDAVEKALRDWDARQKAPPTPAELADLYLPRPRPAAYTPSFGLPDIVVISSDASALTDLVEAGIGALVDSVFS
jgi:Zn-finger nucleic acid-binding protein/DNA-directed RNA polymerase subunit RPC12/RpoP